jgi:hypothetical protein
MDQVQKENNLNKNIIAVLLMVSSTVFASEFASVEYSPSITDKKTDRVVADSIAVTAGTTALNFVKLDGKLESIRARGTGNLTNDLQARGTMTKVINQNLNVWGRGGLGRSYTANNDYSFYTYTAGADLKMYDNLTGFASAERNNSFRAGHPHSTLYELGLGYSLTKNDMLKASYQRTLGDLNRDGFKLGYFHSFN